MKPHNFLLNLLIIINHKHTNMVEIFLSYSHKDESVLNEFLKSTAPMQRGEKLCLKFGMIGKWLVEQT